jgi:hypothetical protein
LPESLLPFARRTGSAQRGISAKQDIKIAGVSRVFVVVGLALLTATLVYMTGAILTLAWGTFLGTALS